MAPSTTDTYTASWPPVSGSSCPYNQTVKLEVAADDMKANHAVPASSTPNYVYDHTAPSVTITPPGDVTEPVQIKANIADSESGVNTGSVKLEIYCPTTTTPPVKVATITTFTSVNSVYTFNLWPSTSDACQYGEKVRFQVYAEDKAWGGINNNSDSIDVNYLFDDISPTLTSLTVDRPKQSDPTVNISVTAKDNANGSGIAGVDLEITCKLNTVDILYDLGAMASPTILDPDVYTYAWDSTDQCDNNSDVTVTVTTKDIAGNPTGGLSLSKTVKNLVNVPIQSPRYAWMTWLRWPFSWLTPPSVSPLWKSTVGWW
jgi:hypothetical protein